MPGTILERGLKTLRNLELRIRHPDLRVSRYARVARSARLDTIFGGVATIAADTVVSQFAVIQAAGGEIHIGKRGWIGPHTTLLGQGGLYIGDDALIASHAVLVAANHCFDRVNVPINQQGQTERGIVVEDDVWIAAHAVILDGVTVGRGAIVAAGAVVNTDVAPYSLVAGVPAKHIRWRGAMDRRPAELSVARERTARA